MKLLQNLHVLFAFVKVHNPLPLPHETTSERPKVIRTCGVFNILTWKCASHHNGVHFSDMSTSKSVPNLVCFAHFDLEMCLAPQRRPLFSTSQFRKVVRPWCFFAHFDLDMCFAPQRRALFRRLNFQKWSENVLYMLTWKCASRHGV